MDNLPDHKVEKYIDQSELENLVRKLADSINNDYENSQGLLLVGLLKGSCVFLCDLMRKLDGKIKVDFMQVSSYGNSMKSGEVKIIKDIDQDLSGLDVLIVEDLIESGKTLSKVMDMLQKRNPNSLEICTLLDKYEKRKKNVQVKYIGKPIDDVFVVGFGIDWAECYRQLPYIGRIKILR
mmetsp:Transcript_18679/g.22916  ORF Transcript_18679/g.22916 Transcript_18679/m.22916 type:complete len:180 (+) Transcript_18679:450-989(+)